MSVNNEIIEMIPLLVQGKLSKPETERIEAEISNSKALQAEYSFWQGIYAIRRSMPKFDFSNHPAVEALDRFALGRINQFSSEYTEVAVHLQQCPSCSSDIELLRLAVKSLPEDPGTEAVSEKGSWLSQLIGSAAISKIVAPIALTLILVLSAVVMLNRPGEESLLVRVSLTMQNEKRSIADEGQVPEMQVALQKSTRELIFAFPTDRVELPDYHYSIDLNRRGGGTHNLENQQLECLPTELLNQCELKVTDKDVLNVLKEGGSFSLSIREEFPEGVSLVPAEYEFYFNVSVSE